MENGIVDAWRTDGFVILPGFLSADDLAPALGEMDTMFPTPNGFHDGTDPRRTRYVEDEFDGIDKFPFSSTEFSLLAVHPRIVQLAENLLGQTDLRISSAEAWAKYTGATPYEQALHRDYLTHTILVPSTEDRYQHLELFVFLVDVPEELGPPHLVSRDHTDHLPMNPNFYPRRGGSGEFVSTADNSNLYAAEQSGAGPAGTVIAFNTRTFHRGTGLSKPRGARYSMQLIYRPAHVDWGQRMAWAARSHMPEWYRFVHRATPRQLELFGFPPPGHQFWTAETLDGMQQRYPHLDLRPWREAQYSPSGA
ncbi:phytanoyl-CoA dioxygenase family protein [Phytoactinopolyspora alkaliphila]|uniref:Phytanoyl-CoA dioxygenase family protein n=1 Tax=Phytoactinopolyspora alkaliphila TaxID=1783498 RepID=A0A6N9YSQ1_9ACTN|nr:phytanoyl-CoA dioxygenase family protein [Phytoactinopolyspora alkaliphila]NED97858.1 phytanoyl-CoA dioxygenase family protein [Phytoactinopolyspora alkaliphila]